MDIGTTTRYFYLHPDTDVFEEHSRKLTDHPTGNLVIVHEHHEGHGLITYQFDIQLVGCAVHMQKVFDLVRRFVPVTTTSDVEPMSPATLPGEEEDEEGEPEEAEAATEDAELDTALEALHVAAAAILNMKRVIECTADNDHKSGEIIFVTSAGTNWILRLEEFEN